MRTLMRKMGIEALYKKPRLSKPHPDHKVYPYLLRRLDITEANAVWCSDITYIPMAKGFCYLVAIMDWASSKVLSWRLSNTLDASFCIEALKEAIPLYGTPQIFNTDQGSQFTSDEFTSILNDHNIRISMDGQGRWMDNVFIEGSGRASNMKMFISRHMTQLLRQERSLPTGLPDTTCGDVIRVLTIGPLMRFTGVCYRKQERQYERERLITEEFGVSEEPGPPLKVVYECNTGVFYPYSHPLEFLIV